MLQVVFVPVFVVGGLVLLIFICAIICIRRVPPPRPALPSPDTPLAHAISPPRTRPLRKQAPQPFSMPRANVCGVPFLALVRRGCTKA